MLAASHAIVWTHDIKTCTQVNPRNRRWNVVIRMIGNFKQSYTRSIVCQQTGVTHRREERRRKSSRENQHSQRSLESRHSHFAAGTFLLGNESKSGNKVRPRNRRVRGQAKKLKRSRDNHQNKATGQVVASADTELHSRCKRPELIPPSATRIKAGGRCLQPTVAGTV